LHLRTSVQRVALKVALAVCGDEEGWPVAGGPPRRVCVFFDSRSRGDGDDVGGSSLQWTPPATALTTALKTFGSRTSETHNCTHEVCLQLDVCAQTDERNAAALAAAVAQAAAAAAVAPAIGWRSLYFLHGPDLDTTSQLDRSDFQSTMGACEGAFSAEPAAGDHPRGD
jgi:hypothetical protein